MSDAELMAMSGTADAALQVAGNIAASTFNYQHTKELAKYQNDMAISNWRMANEYNSPVNQMKRFEEAGLNPNLMYGQGNPGNATTVGGPTLHNMDYKNPFAGVSLATAYQQAKGLALENQRKELINNEETGRAYESELRRHAIDLFSQDHTEGIKPGERLFKVGPHGSSSWIKNDAIRNSPVYQQLEQLWQRGIINEKNIGYIVSRTGLIEGQTGAIQFNEERSKLLRDVLDGDFDMQKLLKLIIIQLLNSTTSPGVVGKIF